MIRCMLLLLFLFPENYARGISSTEQWCMKAVSQHSKECPTVAKCVKVSDERGCMSVLILNEVFEKKISCDKDSGVSYEEWPSGEVRETEMNSWCVTGGCSHAIGDPIGNCPMNDRCVQPTLTNAEITCSSGALEARVSADDAWISISRVDCTTNLAEAYFENGLSFTKTEQIQCRIERGCEMSSYTANMECSKDQICLAQDLFFGFQNPDILQPDASTYVCPPFMQLEAKFTDQGPFEPINQIKCERNRFVVIMEDNKETEHIPLQFRCAILRGLCTKTNPLVSECSTGDNLCERQGGNFRRVFMNQSLQIEAIDGLQCNGLTGSWEATKGARLVEVTRGSNVYCLLTATTTTAASRNESDENLCTERNPLVSHCDPDDYLCGKAVFNDSRVVTCKGSSMMTNSTGHVDTIEDLRSNAVTGKWEAKKSGRLFEVQKGSNVYCQFKDCLRTNFFKRCTNDDEHCVEIIQERNTLRCPGSATIWTTADNEIWAEMTDVHSITCERGVWVAAVDKPLHSEITGVKCLALSASQRTGVAVYVTVGILLFLVILIAGLVIFCRVTSRGWLHQIISKKFRGANNNEEKGSESKKDSSKKDSSKKDTSPRSPHIQSSNGISPIITPSPKKRKDKSPVLRNRPTVRRMAKRMQMDFKRKKEGLKDTLSSVTDEYSIKEKPSEEKEKDTVFDV